MWCISPSKPWVLRTSHSSCRVGRRLRQWIGTKLRAYRHVFAPVRSLICSAVDAESTPRHSSAEKCAEVPLPVKKVVGDMELTRRRPRPTASLDRYRRCARCPRRSRRAPWCAVPGPPPRGPARELLRAWAGRQHWLYRGDLAEGRPRPLGLDDAAHAAILALCALDDDETAARPRRAVLLDDEGPRLRLRALRYAWSAAAQSGTPTGAAWAAARKRPGPQARRAPAPCRGSASRRTSGRPDLRGRPGRRCRVHRCDERDGLTRAEVRRHLLVRLYQHNDHHPATFRADRCCCIPGRADGP